MAWLVDWPPCASEPRLTWRLRVVRGQLADASLQGDAAVAPVASVAKVGGNAAGGGVVKLSLDDTMDEEF